MLSINLRNSLAVELFFFGTDSKSDNLSYVESVALLLLNLSVNSLLIHKDNIHESKTNKFMIDILTFKP